MAANLTRNGFQHQLMNKGMKNLGVQFLYRVKFQVLDGDFEESTANAESNTNSASTDIVKRLNTPTVEGNTEIDFIYFCRGVSGLPKFEVDPIKDNFFIYTQQVPGKPKNDFGPLTMDLIIKESGDPVINFLKEINKLTRLQGQDFYAIDSNGNHVNPYKSSQRTNRDSSTEYEDAVVPIVTAQYNAQNFANNDTKRIFFNMTVSALEYGTYKPWMTYKFNNCWISKVDLGDAFNDSNNLIKGKMNVTYDFPEILFYDPDAKAFPDS